MTKGSPKREAVIRAILASPQLGPVPIAHQAGCAVSYAMKVMADAAKSRGGESAYVPTPTFVGADGKTYHRRRDGSPVRTPAAAAQRRARLRTMAAEGYHPRQIADALEMSTAYVRQLLHEEGIASPAARVTHKTHQHNGVRIIEHIVMDAEGLTAEVKLIDLAALPPARIPTWIASLEAARLHLGAFIRQLRRLAYETSTDRSASPEQWEAGDAPPVESAAGPVQADAGAPGGRDPT